MVLITKKWRTNKWVFWSLLLTEFPIVIAALTLFAVAQPDLYRTKLQLVGAARGWNSDPNLRLYAAANGRPFKQPLPWSQFLTNYNVVISIISMFFMLTKATLYILHCFIPLLSALVHLALAVMYVYSVYAQAGPDRADPAAIQAGPPWTLTRGCGFLDTSLLRGYCAQAKASFAITVLLMVLYLVFLGHAVWNVVPSREQRERYREKQATMRELRKVGRADRSVLTDEMQWQLHNMPTPALPPPTAGGTVFTPRTNAFNLLNGVRAPVPALPVTAAMAAARSQASLTGRPNPTVVIPPSGPAVPVHKPTPNTGSPMSSATPMSTAVSKSDLPFRNMV